MFEINELVNNMTYQPVIKEADSIYFNEEGIRIPRVTHILDTMLHSDELMYWANGLGFKGIRYKKYMEDAANIGTVAHAYIAKFLKDGFRDTNNVPFNGFLLWYDNLINQGHQVELIGSEQAIGCKWFAGTYDALMKIDGKLYLIDFKTSKNIRYNYFLQLAAYTYLLEEMGYKIDGHIILQLNKESTPSYREYILIMDNLEHRTFMDNCIKTFLSLLYSYYNVAQVKEGYKQIF